MKRKITFLVLMLSIITFNLKAQENAFIIDYPGGILSTIDLTDGSTDVVGTAFSNMGGMEFGPGGVLYGMNSTSNSLFEIDTADATSTLIGSSSIPSTHIWTGLAYDASAGIMYGVAAHGTATGSANLYTIDLTDGSTTLVGSQGVATALSCLAIDDNGTMYALQLGASPKLYEVDKTDGTVTLIGTVSDFGGAGMGYGMDFNPDDQTMYITAYDSFSFNSDLYTIDLTDASTTVVAPLVIWTSGLAILSPFFADFEADATTVCSGSTVNFTDGSAGATSWSWTFEGGTPSTSTDQNPSVVYSTPGIYDVTLEVTNGTGDTETEFKSEYIIVLETPAQADMPDGDEDVCTDQYYEYTIDEVLYAEDYEWEIDPVDAGTLTPNMNEASLSVADDWTGDFTIKVRATNMCGDGDWSDDLEGTVYQSPEEFGLQGGGTMCEGSDGVEITLDGSQSDITYELFLDGVSTGITVDGTGSEISFGLVTEAGFYDAQGSNGTCTTYMTNQVMVVVSNLPSQPATPAGPESVCTEETSDYTSEGGEEADSYSWMITPEAAGTITSDGLNATVTWDPEFSGSAYVSLYGMNDCGEGESSEELEISVGAPTPEISGEAMVCDWSDENYEVAENDGSTYTWEVTGGTISMGQGTYMVTVSWSGEGSGTLTVEEETADGCAGDSETFDVTIDDCTGVNEIGSLTVVNLYPNPASDVLTVEVNSNEKSEVQLTIHNQLGQVLISKTIVTNGGEMKQSINISSLDSGIYFVKLNNQQSTTTKQFVKN